MVTCRNVKTLSNLQIEELINGRMLKNTMLLLHAQRSSRRKNCRIGGLLSDIIYLKIQLQSSTLDLAKEILQRLSSEKEFY